MTAAEAERKRIEEEICNIQNDIADFCDTMCGWGLGDKECEECGFLTWHPNPPKGEK